MNKRILASLGAWSALAGFVLITISGLALSQGIFYGGVVFLGVGTGLATVSNLSLMLDMTTTEKVGLFIGAWGMSNAVSRLVGTILGGAVRDVVAQVAHNPVTGYAVVFGIEAIMLLVSLYLLQKIDVGAFRRQAEQPSLLEQASLAAD